jgi:hypothetical protein
MKIHLHSRQGLFTVATYGRDSITVHTKHKMFGVPITDFKCFAGGGWAEANDEEQKLFLSVVAPHLLKETLETEAKIKALASLIDLQEKAKQSATAFIDQYSSKLVNIQDEDENDDYSFNELTIEDYKQWNDDKTEELNNLRNKMRSVASKVYSLGIDFSNFQVLDGIKFIIQQNHYDDTYRFCWDPYGFVSNGHSDISSIYRENGWCTVNGGWIKIIKNNVILYAKSGDYGVYNYKVATECARQLFPGKNIYSFAGRNWTKAHDAMFDDLPF